MFSFFAVIALSMLITGTNYMLFCLVTCILHEFGHIIAMCICDVNVERMTFYGAGIKINLNNSKITNFVQDVFILIAGVIINFTLFFVFYYLFNNTFSAKIFAVFNLLIGILNLIPFRYTDGGKILSIFIDRFFVKYNIIIKKAVSIFCLSIVIIFAIIYSLKNGINLSLYVSVLYVILSEVLL